MNKTPLLFLPLAFLALAGCAGSNSTSSAALSSEAAHDIHWLTPTGTPTLAFYDQGKNTNWVSSSNPQTVVVPAFATSDYDAIVFDGTSGLNILSKNSAYPYRLASWISRGNFYVVSTKHTASDAFSATSTIEGFVKTGNASQAFMALAKNAWGWAYQEANLTFETGVAQVKANLENNDTAYDYYIVAEPVLTASKATLKAKGITLNLIYDLQSEWKNKYGGEIPAAGLFVNTASYASYPNAIKTFLADTQKRQDSAVKDPASVKSELDAYGDDTAVSARFGYASKLVSALQGNNANRFGIFQTGEATDIKGIANAFQSALGNSAFSDSLFLA